jgi:ATP-dependent Clp protease adaptor protein ClpS
MTDILEDIKLDEKLKEDIEEPKKYKVVLLNDDKTPMEWVIGLLIEIFKHDNHTAQQLTLTIHNEGSGIAGIYSYEVAETKMQEATQLSRNNGFPLVIKLEKE